MDYVKQGQLVVVKAVGDEPLIMVVHSVSSRAVFVNSEEEWNKRVRGKPCLEPVGFPIKDVYLYSEDVAVDIKIRGEVSGAGYAV
jgi:hypothetical protein